MIKHEVNEESEMWRNFRERKQQKRAERLERARPILAKSGLKFTISKDGYCYLFREIPTLKVNYYPSGAVWVFNNRTFYGSVQQFINWYRNKHGKS